MKTLSYQPSKKLDMCRDNYAILLGWLGMERPDPIAELGAHVGVQEVGEDHPSGGIVVQKDCSSNSPTPWRLHHPLSHWE